MTTFHIPDMSCGHCVGVITKTVQRIDPRATVEADLASHTVQIQSEKDPGTLAAALAEAGYPPQGAPV
jgi:copper chaperone